MARKPRTVTMAEAQRAYDNMAPPDDAPVAMRCVQCGHCFSSDDAEQGEDCMLCPACGDNDTVEDKPDPSDDFDEPDDSIDEAAAFGGRDYP